MSSCSFFGNHITFLLYFTSVNSIHLVLLFFIQFVNLYLLIGGFSLFAFNVLIDSVEFKAKLSLFVFNCPILFIVVLSGVSTECLGYSVRFWLVRIPILPALSSCQNLSAHLTHPQNCCLYTSQNLTCSCMT